MPEAHYYNTGLILPDITKRWVKSYKHLLPFENHTYTHQQLLKGVVQHYEADRLFHSSSYFNRYLKLFTASINATPFDKEVSRKWFIAHIALELMIDRMLVKSHPESVDSFYRSLISTELEEIDRFMKLAGSDQNAQFFEFYRHFTGVKYIYYYPDNNKFIYSLNRIMERAGVPPLDEENADRLLDVLLTLENNYFADVEEHKVHLKNIFVNEG